MMGQENSGMLWVYRIVATRPAADASGGSDFWRDIRLLTVGDDGYVIAIGVEIDAIGEHGATFVDTVYDQFQYDVDEDRYWGWSVGVEPALENAATAIPAK